MEKNQILKKTYQIFNCGFSAHGPQKSINQDAYFIHTINENISIIGIADGVSNSKYGGKGALIITETLSDYINRNADEIIKTITADNKHQRELKTMFKIAREKLEKVSSKNENGDINDYAATLSIAIVDLKSRTITGAVIGDSPIWIVKSEDSSSGIEAEKFITAESHTYSNVVRPLTDKRALEKIIMKTTKLDRDAYILVMMSDGVESFLDEKRKYTNILKEFGILNQKNIITIPTNINTINQKFLELFSVLHKKERDDKTLVFSVISEGINTHIEENNTVQQDINILKDRTTKHIAYIYEELKEEKSNIEKNSQINRSNMKEINSIENKLNKTEKDIYDDIKRLDNDFNIIKYELSGKIYKLYDEIDSEKRETDRLKREISDLKEHINKLKSRTIWDIIFKKSK